MNANAGQHEIAIKAYANDRSKAYSEYPEARLAYESGVLLGVIQSLLYQMTEEQVQRAIPEILKKYLVK